MPRRRVPRRPETPGATNAEMTMTNATPAGKVPPWRDPQASRNARCRQRGSRTCATEPNPDMPKVHSQIMVGATVTIPVPTQWVPQLSGDAGCHWRVPIRAQWVQTLACLHHCRDTGADAAGPTAIWRCRVPLAGPRYGQSYMRFKRNVFSNSCHDKLQPLRMLS